MEALPFASPLCKNCFERGRLKVVKSLKSFKNIFNVMNNDVASRGQETAESVHTS